MSEDDALPAYIQRKRKKRRTDICDSCGGGLTADNRSVKPYRCKPCYNQHNREHESKNPELKRLRNIRHRRKLGHVSNATKMEAFIRNKGLWDEFIRYELTVTTPTNGATT